MKNKLGLLVIMALVVSAFVGCTSKKETSGQAVAPANVAESGYLNEVYYKDIPISRILELNYENKSVSLESVLDEPLRNVVPIYSYDGMEIYSLSGYYVQVISGTDLSLFTIDGVSLDKSITELINVLGKPIYYEENYMMRYNVSTSINYLIEFWFENPDEYANSIRFAPLEQ